jgi:hypothetical protein
VHTFEPREFYTVAEVAAILRMHPRRFRKDIIKRGAITVHQHRPGATILIRHGDLTAYLESIRFVHGQTKERCE